MSTPCTTARTSWRRVIQDFAVQSLTNGRETAIIFAVPGVDFTIERLQEAHSPDELPEEAVIFPELSYLSIEPREDAVVRCVDRETGELFGEPRLRPDFSGESKVLADHLLRQAWAQAMSRVRRRNWPITE